MSNPTTHEGGRSAKRTSLPCANVRRFGTLERRLAPLALSAAISFAAGTGAHAAISCAAAIGAHSFSAPHSCDQNGSPSIAASASQPNFSLAQAAFTWNSMLAFAGIADLDLSEMVKQRRHVACLRA